jgi:hypothetical protein
MVDAAGILEDLAKDMASLRCHRTFQRRISAITFHRAAGARKRSPGVKQRQTPMFVRLSTLEHYDFTEKIALVPKTRV